MKIAVAYQEGRVFQHFGHTRQFKLYTAEEGRLTDARVVSTDGQGHGALAGFLADQGVDAVICGGIGAGAQAALAQAGIRLYGGVTGEADGAAEALLEGRLSFDPAVQCHHHHGEEGHSCGHHGHEDRQGCAGSGHCGR